MPDDAPTATGDDDGLPLRPPLKMRPPRSPLMPGGHSASMISFAAGERFIKSRLALYAPRRCTSFACAAEA